MKKIALYHGHKPMDRIIDTLSSSCYSHMAILLDDGKVLESYPPHGVRVGELSSNFKGGKVTIYTFNDRIPADVMDMFNKVTDDLVAHINSGKKIGYDFEGVLSFVIKGMHENPDKMFCSELVSLIFEWCNYPLFSVKASMTTPADYGKLGCLTKEQEINL